jgi:hypothetical protein
MALWLSPLQTNSLRVTQVLISYVVQKAKISKQNKNASVEILFLVDDGCSKHCSGAGPF